MGALESTVTMYNALNELPDEYYLFEGLIFYSKPNFYENANPLNKQIMKSIDLYALRLTQYRSDYSLPNDIEQFRTRILEDLKNSDIGIMCAGERFITFNLLVRAVTKRALRY